MPFDSFTQTLYTYTDIFILVILLPNIAIKYDVVVPFFGLISVNICFSIFNPRKL